MSANEEFQFSYRCSIFGHSIDVRSVVRVDSLPNTLASGSRDKTVKIWKPVGPTEFVETHLMTGASHFISCLCFAPQSDKYPLGLILAGSNDCNIYGFSIESSQLVVKLTGHSSTVSALTAGNSGIVISGSWDETVRIWHDSNCRILEGHTAPVWALALFDNEDLLTGSADKTIKLWKSGECKKIFRGHEDCVRGLAILSCTEFLSCSNDTTVRLWETSGVCIYTFIGHTNYIYDITIIDYSGEFATCGEDYTLKIWKKDCCIQTLCLPFKTIWSVCVLANGDLAVGGCDGSIRIFTRHKELVAPPEETLEYEREVGAVQQSKDAIGDLKLDDVVGLDALKEPGLEDGKTILCRETSDKVCVYKWSASEFQWIKIGDVFDAKENKKKQFQGKEYDYVFDIQLEDEKYSHLPYNKGENPYAAAQRFIDQNNCSQYYLDQIAKFIIANVPEGMQFQMNTSNDVDPFTGQSRYVPSNSSLHTPPPAHTYGTSGRNETNTKAQDYYPKTEYIKFNSANMEGIRKKLEEFNNDVHPSTKVSDEEIKLVLLLANLPEKITDQQMEILDKMMMWPPGYVFPVLDVFRLAVRCEAMDQRVGEVKNSIVPYLMKHLDQCTISANRMLILRTFCNMFGQPCGESIVIGHFEKICAGTLDGISTSQKQYQIALATLYLNFAVALNKSLFSNIQLLCDYVVRVFANMNEPEALFRILVAIGTLLVNTVAKKHIKQSGVSQRLQELLMKKDQQDKITICATCLIDVLG